MFWNRNLISAAALGVFVVLATGSEETETSGVDDWNIEAGGSNGSSSSGPAIEISAKDLSAEYDKNEVAADMKYKDKKVKVSGKVDDIGKDFMDEVYVTLEGNDLFQGVQVYFKNADEEGIAATLEKGQNVVIEGECDGLLINVQIEDAVFVEH